DVGQTHRNLVPGQGRSRPRSGQDRAGWHEAQLAEALLRARLDGRAERRLRSPARWPHRQNSGPEAPSGPDPVAGGGSGRGVVPPRDGNQPGRDASDAHRELGHRRRRAPARGGDRGHGGLRRFRSGLLPGRRARAAGASGGRGLGPDSGLGQGGARRPFHPEPGGDACGAARAGARGRAPPARGRNLGLPHRGAARDDDADRFGPDRARPCGRCAHPRGGLGDRSCRRAFSGEPVGRGRGRPETPRRARGRLPCRLDDLRDDL
ncbi:MAG: Chaperone required for the assembly of the mitochondrial F1-ATPase, partial [uncultured Microvirga sp.]